MCHSRLSSLSIVGLIAGLLAPLLSLNAQVLIAAPKDATATAVAQRSLNLMGTNQLVPGQTVTVTGAITLSADKPVVFPVVITSRGSSQMRSVITTPKGPRLFIVNNGHGVIRYPDGTVKWLADENMVSQRVSHIPAISLLSEYASPGTSLENIGPATVDGRLADVVAIGIYSGNDTSSAQQEAKKTRTLIYSDHASGLVLRVQQLNYGEDIRSDAQQFETRYSDYRDVSGVLVPFHQQLYVDGRLLQDFVISSVTFGTIVSDADFALLLHESNCTDMYRNHGFDIGVGLAGSERQSCYRVSPKRNLPRNGN